MPTLPGPPPVRSKALARAPIVIARSGWPRAIGLVLAMLILTGAAFGYYVLHSMFSFADKAAGLPDHFSLVHSQVTYTTQIDSMIGNIKHTPKLIINTYDIDVEIKKTAASGWGVLYWGTTDVFLRAHQNKIQYYVPVETLSTGNFTYDSQHKVLHATIPLPRIDEEVVEVQSDPSKVDVRTDLGWLHTDGGMGQALRTDARRDLRQAVINAGKGEAQEALAEKDARNAFTRLLTPIAQTLGGDIKIEVDFQPATTE